MSPLRDFDRRFRPTSARVRERWERLALAQRRGEPIPPIDVYRIGDLHFVRDGHHRVSIAMATGQQTIEGYVTEVITSIPADGIRRRGDLLMKGYDRIFRARVPLPPASQAKIAFTDPWCFAELGEGVEAWGARCIQAERRFMDREDRQALVRRGVHSGCPYARRGGSDRPPHSCGSVHADRP